MAPKRRGAPPDEDPALAAARRAAFKEESRRLAEAQSSRPVYGPESAVAPPLTPLERRAGAAAGSASAARLAQVVGSGRPICVTGATGYVAGHIVKRLLAAGHTVHGTCRNPEDARSTAHLRALPGAGERLVLFRADLLRDSDGVAFDDALRGCGALIHTASPYTVSVGSRREADRMIATAEQGTEVVLRAAQRCATVERVVLTASSVTVFGDATERGKGHVFTDADWNLIADRDRYPYYYSKVAAERRAWAIEAEVRAGAAGGGGGGGSSAGAAGAAAAPPAAAAAGRSSSGGGGGGGGAAASSSWNLVTVHPPAVWGPPISARLDGESVEQAIDLLNGRLWPWAPQLGVGVVDARDAALAHCAAALAPHATGRYLINGQSAELMSYAARLLRRAYPTHLVPILTKPPKLPLLLFGPLLGLPRPMTRALYRKVPQIDASRAAGDLGLRDYIPLDDTILDMAAAVVARGMVRKLPFARRGVGKIALCVWLPVALALVLLVVVLVRRPVVG
jgi:nucleoside-diphosphate-sugar epimerase